MTFLFRCFDQFKVALIGMSFREKKQVLQQALRLLTG